MAPLPARLAPHAAIVGWRVDALALGAQWDSGIGAERCGGRWNPIGLKAVYCAIDPATAIIEVAVHRGFKVLDAQPHLLTSLELLDAAHIHVVQPVDVPNPAWLHSGVPSAGQQAFGAAQLLAYDFVLFPSVVSKSSWNLVFNPDRAEAKYRQRAQDRLVLDTRLNSAR
jgi:RES domain-containing protein